VSAAAAIGSPAINQDRGGVLMHAVVVRVTIEDFDTAVAALREQVAPRVKQAPGFVAGYWTRKEQEGISMIVFESEEAAQRTAEMLPVMPTRGITFDSVKVLEVVEHA
jgi:hypothetical protein